MTSQVATSALPYYHTLYSKSEGGEEGRVGVKRVHATTTFVPEVGTFKGPLIRNMSKGCPEGRAIKSEQQPRGTTCRLEEDDDGSKPRGTPSSGLGGGDAEGNHGDGSEDETSDLCLSSSQRQSHHHHQSHRGGRMPHEDPRHPSHERGPGERGPTPVVAGEVCSSGRSSVPFPGSRAPSVGFQEPEGSSDVALDFSMSRRAREFTDARKCHEDRHAKTSDKCPNSASAGGKGLTYVSNRNLWSTATSTSSCVPKMCSPVQRTEQRDPAAPGVVSSSAAAASPQATHVSFSGHSTSRHGPTIHPPMTPAESENAALNLCKTVTRKKPTTDAAASTSKKKSPTGSSDQPVIVEMSPHVTGSGSRVSQLISKEKRCGSAPPRSFLSDSSDLKDAEEEGEEREEEEEENTECPLESEEKESTEHIGKLVCLDLRYYFSFFSYVIVSLLSVCLSACLSVCCSVCLCLRMFVLFWGGGGGGDGLFCATEKMHVSNASGIVKYVAVAEIRRAAKCIQVACRTMGMRMNLLRLDEAV